MSTSPRGTSKKALSIETWSVDKLVPYPANPRIMGDAAVAKVAGSLKAYGWKQPIVVDPEGVIIVGHTRFAAALKLGLKEVPVVVADDLTANEAKAYRLADNRTAQETSWDYELLNLELGDLGLEFDLSLTGFDDWELTGLSGLEGGGGQGRPTAGLEDTGLEGDSAERLRVIIVFEDEEEASAFWTRLGMEASEGKVLYRWSDLA